MLYDARGRDYHELTHPKITRKQNIALNAFYDLNRERDFLAVANSLFPCYIKESCIKRYYAEYVHEPISFEFFKILLQALDDAFVEFSKEQVKASGEK